MTDYTAPTITSAFPSCDAQSADSNIKSLDALLTVDGLVATGRGKVLMSWTYIEANTGFKQAGEFGQGGTITSNSQLVFNTADNWFYKHIGTITTPVSIPSAPDASWEKFNANNHEFLTNRNAVGAHDQIYRRQVETAAEVAASGFVVGDKIWIEERQAAFDVKTGSANGFDKVYAGLGLIAEYVYTDIINAVAVGLIAGGGSASVNNSVMSRLVEMAVSKPIGERPVIEWPAGKIAYSVSPNFGHSDLSSVGRGSGSTFFVYSGSASAWNIDPSEFDSQFRYGINHSGFTIDCGANATHGVYEENTAHCKYRDIILLNGSATCIHWENALTVLNTYEDCGSPISRFPVTSYPSECLRLSASPSKGQASTANTYINWIAEGATLSGIRLLDADVNTFVGGTSESNTGRGVTLATSCRNNTFQNLDMEGNTNEDFNDAGQSTTWKNCLATSSSGATISGSSILSKVTGGYYDTLRVEAGAKGASTCDLIVNVKGTGVYSDLGTNTVKRNIYDKTAGAFKIANMSGSRVAITVGASPFVYQNTSTQLQQVLVRGGTITQILWGRDGDVAVVAGAGEGGNPNKLYILAPGDTLNVSYSVAPTMNAIPMGVQNL